MQLRDYRDSVCLSQKDIATKVGVTISAISAYENGRVSPSLMVVKKIEEVTQGKVTFADWSRLRDDVDKKDTYTGGRESESGSA